MTTLSVVLAGGAFGGVVLFLAVTLCMALGFGWRAGVGLYLAIMVTGLLWAVQQ